MGVKPAVRSTEFKYLGEAVRVRVGRLIGVVAQAALADFAAAAAEAAAAAARAADAQAARVGASASAPDTAAAAASPAAEATGGEPGTALVTTTVESEAVARPPPADVGSQANAGGTHHPHVVSLLFDARLVQ